MNEPSRTDLERLLRRGRWLIRPFERIFRPSFSGWEAIPEERPLLFVGNHTLYGVLDIPFLAAALLREKGIVLRGLADRFHYQIPIWRDILTQIGGVCGTPDNCARLMQSGEAIIVFPGGAREVTKRKGERYRLLWKQRYGFARLAAQHRCTVIPFASVGIEDMFHILFDGSSILDSPLGRWLEKQDLRTDTFFPLSVGTGPYGLPSLQRLYFHFAPPVSFRDVDPSDTDAVWALRETTRQRIEESIAFLQAKQASDPDRFIPLRRLFFGGHA